MSCFSGFTIFLPYILQEIRKLPNNEILNLSVTREKKPHTQKPVMMSQQGFSCRPQTSSDKVGFVSGL